MSTATKKTENKYNWAQSKKLEKQQQTQRKVEVEIKANIEVDKYGDNKKTPQNQ